MSAPKPPALTPAEVNHLRRLVAWVSCEMGQPPEEMVPMVRDIAQKLGGISEYGKAAMVQAHAESSAVPKYIRAAVKALRKTLAARPDGIEDAEVVDAGETLPKLPGTTRALPAPLTDSQGDAVTPLYDGPALTPIATIEQSASGTPYLSICGVAVLYAYTTAREPEIRALADAINRRALPAPTDSEGGDHAQAAPDGWCSICGGQDGEHKPGCEPVPGDIL